MTRHTHTHTCSAALSVLFLQMSCHSRTVQVCRYNRLHNDIFLRQTQNDKPSDCRCAMLPTSVNIHWKLFKVYNSMVKKICLQDLNNSCCSTVDCITMYLSVDQIMQFQSPELSGKISFVSVCMSVYFRLQRRTVSALLQSTCSAWHSWV